ncbi:MAG: DUF3499 family protein [Microbacteriaceae bacterium]
MTRSCRKPGCSRDASSTLTMDYASKIAVLGLLSPTHDPTALDLCDAHAAAFSAPQGWKLVRYRERNEQG